MERVKENLENCDRLDIDPVKNEMVDEYMHAKAVIDVEEIHQFEQRVWLWANTSKCEVEIRRDVVRQTIVEAYRCAKKWIDSLNDYYFEEVGEQMKGAFKMFFSGLGMNKTRIDWDVFKGYVNKNNPEVRRLVVAPAGERIENIDKKVRGKE